MKRDARQLTTAGRSIERAQGHTCATGPRLRARRARRAPAARITLPPPTAALRTSQVIGVIRHKYLFKNRPKALISKPATRGGGGGGG
jgi:hypothetical protein